MCNLTGDKEIQNPTEKDSTRLYGRIHGLGD